jgi:flagellar M-ring protein FliF
VPAGEGGEGSYTKESRSVNNSVGKVTERATSGPGALKRQSVAVVLDAASPAALDTQRITDLVTAAAGIDPARGDTVSVAALPFDTTAAEAAQAELEAARAAEESERTDSMLRTGVLGGLVLVMVVAFLVASRRRKAGAMEELQQAEDAQFLQAVAVGDGAAALGAGDGAGLTALPAAPNARALEMAGKREEVAQLVERQPEEVAELLRGWLADRRS